MSKMTKDEKSLKDNDRYTVRLSGAGGQGLGLAGKIMAEAAAIYDNKNVVQTQSYGPEARGGSSKTEVVISSREIDHPRASVLDLLLALNQESCDKYFGDLKPDGILIVDSTYVQHVPSPNACCFPFTKMAEDKIGVIQTANIMALGAITIMTGIVPEEAMVSAVKKRVPPQSFEKNDAALRLGFELAKEMKALAGKN
jgi:2-oxoglutarate ferredoxin oxidoreductase subunit gamma